jgi:hypothetical protein
LRPVSTPLDGQVIVHKQLRARTKSAARPKEERLKMDFSFLKPQEKILSHLEFDFEKLRGAKSA